MAVADRSVQLGVKITADGSAFVNGVKVAKDALKDFGDSTKASGDAAAAAQRRRPSRQTQAMFGIA